MLASLVRESQGLRRRGGEPALAEANRLAIVYWRTELRRVAREKCPDDVSCPRGLPSAVKDAPMAADSRESRVVRASRACPPR